MNLKANKQELRLRKLAQTALEKVGAVLDYRYSSRHDTYIAFNCKVHVWLDVDDVKVLIRKSKMTLSQIRTVLETFDDGRLYSFHNHILESSASDFKDWLTGCGYEGRDYVNKNSQGWANDISTCSYPALRNILSKKRSLQTKTQAIHDFFKPGFDALYKINLIDTENAGTAGRSGGHFAFTEADTFDNYKYILDDFLDNGFSGDNLSSRYNNTRDEWHEEFSECIENLKGMVETCEGALFIIDEGVERVKALNEGYFINRLLEEIESEIGIFEVITDEEVLSKWMNNQDNINLRTTAGSYSYLRLIENKGKKSVQTSQNIFVSTDEAITLYDTLKQLNPNETNVIEVSIGNFTTNKFGKIEGLDEPVLVAGCHKIKWSFIQSFYNTTLKQAA